MMWLPLVLSFTGGLFTFRMVFQAKRKGFHNLAATILAKAEEEAELLRKECEAKLKQQEIEKLVELEKLADKRKQKEAHLEKKESELAKRTALIEKREQEVAATAKRLEKEEATCAAMTREEAEHLLLQRVEQEMLGKLMHVKQQAEENADKEATRILITAMHRMALPAVLETTTETVALPNDSMKRRIIGREGRNIRALERATGVNFLLDDTPHAIVISSFDPLRKAIAAKALTALIQDGRIHPSRIEELVEKTEKDVHRMMQEKGERAALKVGVMRLHPELIMTLGKLAYRNSYGQNVLEHSVEVATLMGLMAQELGLNSARARRIGLLHDIGKALSQNKEGAHALAGHDMALKYGEPDEIANGIGCHHSEMQPLTFEGALCSSADALSGGRPAARLETVETYFRRLKKLEQIATECDGVEKAYALSSGKEVRIMVQPDLVSDERAVILARSLARKIEAELTYPGKIKVTIIREKRSVEYAI